MKRLSLLMVVRLTAALFLIAGTVMLIGAARHHSRHRAAAELARTQLETLLRLESVAAQAQALETAWELPDSQPLSWRSFARQLNLENALEIRETETAINRPGWIIRRAEISAPALSAANLRQLIDRAQTLPHPWRLRSSTLRANPGEPVTINARLIFETPVQTP